MKKSFRVLSATLAAALLGACLSPAALAADDGPVTKEETVYLTLAPDGAVRTQTVSEWLHSDAGLRGVADRSLLNDITNLKGSELPRAQDGALYWDMDGQDVYYQGTTDKTPPVTARIQYFLDGTEMTAEEITGQSGHLKVTVTLTNNEVSVQQVNGRARPICTPFVTLVGAVLDGEHFSNVSAPDGTVQGDGSSQMVGFSCLPGVADSLEGLLTGKLDTLQDKLLDSVSFEADVTDLEVPSLMIACATDASLLDGEDLWEDADELFGDLDDLREATDELLDGTQELFDAVSGDLLDGVTELNDGAAELRDGAQELRDAVTGDLTDGTAALNDGLGQLCAQNDALNGGAASLADGVLQVVNVALAGKLPAGTVITYENYSDILGMAGGVSDDMRAAAKSQLLEAARGKGLGSMASAASISEDTAFCALLYLSAEKLSAGSLSVEQAMTSAVASIAGQEQHSMEIIGAFAAGQLDENCEPITNLLTQAVMASSDYASGQGTLAALGQLLGGMQSLQGGIQAYTSGVASARAGSQELADSVSGDLTEGVNDLLDGCNELKDGTQELVDSVAGDLLDGVTELNDGVQEYDEEGIRKITDSEDIDNLREIRAIGEQMETQAQSYVSYAGAPEGVTAQVKFVMKTDAPEKPEAVEAEADTAPVKLTLWQRIKRLFGFE